MSVPYPLVEIIIKEITRRPFYPEDNAKALLFGRSSVAAELSTLEALFKQLQIERFPSDIEFDNTTQLAKEFPNKEFVMDATLLHWLGIQHIDILDISCYEGANIEHDICSPLPAHLVGAYDFIFNSSVLDNVFDPSSALKNMMSALKPGGRAIHIEMATYDNFPYLVFSPGWFLDYLTVNNFERCQVYLGQYNTREELIFGPWQMWGCLPLNNTSLSAPTMQGAKALLVVIAERGENSTINVNPVQGHYRREIDQAKINHGLERITKTSLPFLYANNQNDHGVGDTQEIGLWKWVYCGLFG